MMSSVISARLDFQCGHAALVSLPRVKGESSVQRNLRIAMEKSGAQSRACDFCAPRLEIVVPQLTVTPAEEIAEANEAIEAIEAVESIEASEVVEAIESIDAIEASDGLVVVEVVELEAPTPLPVATPQTVVQPVAAGTRRRARRAPVLPRAPRAARARPVAVQPTTNGHVATRRFQVQFRAETVLEAADIREALRLATALGATDVVAITLEN